MSVNLKGIRPKRSSNPPPKAPPLIKPTGSVKLDVAMDVINRAADAWKATPPPEQGVYGVIAAGIGAGMGTFGAPIDVLETGFAAVTADLAAMIPGQPAATVSVTTFGLTIPHAHPHPPSFGVPLPGFGPLSFGGCSSVAIAGEPAARAGDLGVGVTCCGFAPAYECFTGSSNTFIGGSRAARRFDIIRQCDPTLALGTLGKVLGGVGLVAGVAQAGAESAAGKAAAAQVAAAQATADAFALAVSATLGKDPGLPPGIGALCNGVNTVLIGGLPVPDILDMFGGLMKVLKRAKKLRKAKPKANVDDLRCIKPGHPVDPATGAVFDEFEDFHDPSTGFRWHRWYLSAWSDDPRACGPGFRHIFDKRLSFQRTCCVLLDYNGDEFEFPCLDAKAEIYEGTVGGYRLTKTSATTFEVHFGDDAMRFECPAKGRLRWTEARLCRWIGNGLDIHLQYDVRNRLIQALEFGPGTRNATTFKYDRQGRIVRLARGPAGAPADRHTIAQYQYDPDGRLITHTDALGKFTTYAYDREHRLTWLTNRNGYSFRWSYDALGRCIETTGDDGLYKCRFEYEPGRTIVTKGDGGRWTYVYDPWGATQVLVDPYGGALWFEYNDQGRIAAQVDANGTRTEWTYDDTGRLTGRVDAFGYVLPTMDEAPNARPRRETEPTTTAAGWHVGDSVQRLGSTAFLRLPTALRPRLAEVWKGHTPANAAANPATRDQAGRTTAQPDATGARDLYGRDAEGNPVVHTDRDGGIFRKRFTRWNLCTSQEDPGGRVTKTQYDDEMRPVSFTDGGGTVTRYPRDLRGRIERVVRAGRFKERYEYDLADNLTGKYGRDDVLICAYEIGEHGLCIKKTWASGDVLEYGYDRRGRIVEVTTKTEDGNVSVIKREHDLAGAVTADERDGLGVRHGQTEGGARSTVVLGRFVIDYGPGADGEWSVHTPDGTTHAFQHHELGFALADLGNGTREVCCFDAAGRCAGKLRWRDQGEQDATTRSVRYDYSSEGELHRVQDSERGSTHYTYDASHRLVREVSDAGVDASWEYDGAGNIVTHPELGWIEYETGNRLVKVGGEVATYDDRDNLIELRRGIEWTRYSYDSADNLVRVRWSDRPQEWSAAYDGLGRRTWKQHGEDRTELYWDDDRLAAEVAPNGRLRVYVYTSGDAFVPFMFLDYGDGIQADPSEAKPHYIFTNQIGAPIRIENESGEAVWRAERYRAYGELDLAAGASIECSLRWPGHYYDPETGLHCNRYRSYSPRLGRYIQTDPLGVAGGLNTHAAPSNPVATVDLLGLVPPCLRKNTTGRGAGGKKTKPDAESTEPAKLVKATSADVALAASDSRSTTAQGARKNVIAAFITEHGLTRDQKTLELRKLTEKEVSDQFSGHDMSHPLVVGPPPPIPPTLYQRQAPGGGQGSYYAERDATPSRVGISAIVRDKKSGQYVGKELTGYEIEADAPYVKSTAAPALDDWSMRDQPTQTTGGATQWLVPDRSRAKPNGGMN